MRSNIYKKIILAILVLMMSVGGVFAGYSFGVNTTFAAINKKINYQGKLTNASNVAVADGNYIVKFRLYTTATSATTTNIWEEIRTATGDMAVVTSGLFSVMLGSSTALTSVDFNQTLYLGVEICGTVGLSGCDGEMSPRKIIGAVPAAFVADTLDNLSSEQFLRSDTQNATSSANTFLNILQTGAGKVAEFFGTASQSVMAILSNGNVGIGTTSPYAKLSVVGEVVGEKFTATSTTATSTFAGGATFATGGGLVGIATTTPATGFAVGTHCVTADTRLRRRRKKKGAKGEGEDEGENDDDYIYDEVMIKDVETGDEIQSLDPRTGKFTWSRVNGLINTGIQPLIRLTTLSGRQIRTTSVHPYLTRKDEYGDKKMHLPQKLMRFEVDMSMKIEDFSADTIVAIANKEQSFTIMVPRKVKQTLRDNLRCLNTPQIFNATVFAVAIVEALKRMKVIIHELIIDTEYTGYEKIVANIIMQTYPGIYVSFDKIGKKSPAHYAAHGVHTKKYEAGYEIKLAEILENAESALRATVVPSPRGVGNLVGPRTLLVENSIFQSNEFVKRGLWTVASALHEGQYIAVAHGNIPAWEKIVKIEAMPAERVYDIEIEGTHNFIGNDIIAHNTYITGGLGVGVVNNTSGTLTVSGLTTLGNASTTNLTITGKLYDSTSSAGTNGMVLQTTGSASTWVATSSLGFLSSSSIGSGTTGQFPYYADAGTTLTSTSSLFLASSGNVGVGTVSPTALLALNATPATNGVGASIAFKRADTSNYGAGIWNASNGTADYLKFGVGSAADPFGDAQVRMTILASGNVGIGTTTPASKLNVYGTTNYAQFRVEGSQAPGINLYTNSADSNARNYLITANSQATGDFIIYDSTTNTGDPSTGVGNARFVIKTGNIGIGTTSPYAKLSVTNTGTDPSFIVEDSTSPDSTPFIVDASGNVSTGGTLTTGGAIYNNGYNYYSGPVLNVQVSGSNMNFGPQSTSYNLQLYSLNTLAATFSGSNVNFLGNVGIGTTTPYAKLSVDGRGVFNQDVRADYFTSTSTTITNTFPLFTSTTGTTTNFAVTSITSSLLKTNSLGQLVSATPGTDYSNFSYLFPSNATSTLLSFSGGLTSYASTTIGNGTQTGGLTISGGATTTGNAYFAGNVGIGTTSPMSLLGITSSASSQSEDIINIKGAAGNEGYYTGIKIWNNAGTTGVALRNVLGASGFNRFGLYVKDNAGNAETERLSVLSTGQTGIGTTSPWGKLSVTNTGTDPSFIVEDSTSPDSTPFIVDASGNVGIGTTGPTEKLTLNNGYVGFNPDAGNPYGIGGGDAAQLKIFAGGSGSPGTILFGHFTSSTATTFLPDMAISTTGNVGIGTTSPYAKLSVVGQTVSEYFTATSTTLASVFPLFTSTTGTTTNFAVTSITSSLLKTNSLGQLVSATPGTDYSNFSYLFPSNATSTLLSFSGGLTSYASTTIGNGTQTGGLTISGGATTTGNAYFGGNVGIGTATPGSKLSVSGGATVGASYNTTAAPTNGLIVEGNVGIGSAMSVPTQKLDVAGIIVGRGTATYANPTGDLGDGARFALESVTTNPFAIGIGAVDGTKFPMWFQTGDVNGGGFNWYIGTSEKMRIDKDGNVGIGTTTPDAKLVVQGDIKLGTDGGGGSVEGNAVFTQADFDIKPFDDQAVSVFGINFDSNSATPNMDFYWYGYSGDPHRAFRFIDGNTGTERMRIESYTGNIGIGTTSPYAKLSVTNTGTDPSFIVEDSTSPDSTPFIVDASGNVGVGTVAPGYKLDVETSANNDRGIYILNAGSATQQTGLWSDVIGAAATNVAGYFSATGATNNYGLIVANGNVGIGITAPTQKLDVIGFINTDQYSGYKQAGNTILYASSTNFSLLAGQSAGAALLSDGLYNTAIGYEALKVATSSDFNTAVGYQSLRFNTTGYSNTASGYQSLLSNTTGYQNTANGLASLYSNTTGYQNTANGYTSLYFNTTGYYNTANGMQSLYYNTTGFQNTANGVLSLFSNTTGASNTANGFNSLRFNTSATSSTAIGYSAGQGAANYNNQGGVYVGYQAGYRAGTGSDYNTFLGYNSGYGVTTGARNTLIGNSTIAASYNQVTTGSNNIAIGNDVAVASATASNQLNIGNLIYGTGLSGTGGTVSGGNVGIGTTSPYAKLSVTNTGTDPSFIVEDSTSPDSSPFIIDASGNVGIGTAGPRTTLDVTGRAIIGANMLEYGTLNAERYVSAPYATLTIGDQATPANAVGIYMRANGSDPAGISTAGAPLAFYMGGPATTEVMRILGNGNVGIGTTSPLAKLDVYGHLAITGNNQLKFYNGAGSNWSYIKDSVTGTGSPDMGFYVTSDTADVMITSAGNVGIGTVSPSQKLDVVGFINTDQYSGYKQAGNTILYASSTNYSLLAGQSAGAALLSDGLYNTAIGYEALKTVTSSDSNTAVGYQSLYSNTTGYSNTANGMQSLYSNTTGINNTANGMKSLYSNTTGASNTVNGVVSLYYNTSATSSTAFGYSAGQGTANYNNQGGVYVGYQAGFSASTGSDYNTFLGYNSGYGVTTGARNTLIGNSTIAASYNQVTTGSNNIAIGNDVAVASATASNQLNIGNLIYGTGLSGTGATVSGGNVGIGTTSPYAKLSVAGQTVSEYFTATSTTVASIFPNASTTNLTVSGLFFDSLNSAGLNGYVFQSTGVAAKWVATSTLGITGSGSSLFTDAGSFTYLTATSDDVVFGAATTGNAPFWWDVSATTTYIGNGGAGDSVIQLGDDANAWTLGYDDTDKAFRIASSTTLGSSDVFTILKTGGRVGIGTTTPWKTLSVSGTMALSSSLSVATVGNYLCINQTTYEVTSGTTCSASSRRYKDNIIPISYGLDTVMKLNPVSFTYKPEVDPNGDTRLGFIAEEVQVLLPELVALDKDGLPESVDYSKLVSVLTKAIQELNLKVDAFATSTSSSSLAGGNSFMTNIWNFVSGELSSLGVLVSDGMVKMRALAVDTFTVGSREKPSGITLYDEDTGDPYCLKIKNGSTRTSAGECGTATIATQQNTNTNTTTQNNTTTNTGGNTSTSVTTSTTTTTLPSTTATSTQPVTSTASSTPTTTTDTTPTPSTTPTPTSTPTPEPTTTTVVSDTIPTPDSTVVTTSTETLTITP